VRITWMAKDVLELQDHPLAEATRAADKARGVRAIHRRFSDAAR
jgi:hypothetical protein